MSIGLRDTRIRLYAYSDAGSDGLAVPTYTYQRTVWGRKEPPTGREAPVGERLEQTVEAVVVLSDRVAVPPRALVKVGGQCYKAMAVLPRRLGAEQELRCVTADAAAFTIVGDPA